MVSMLRLIQWFYRYHPVPIEWWHGVLAFLKILPPVPRCDFGLYFDRCGRWSNYATMLSFGRVVGYWCAQHKASCDRELHLSDLGRGR